MTDIAVDEVQRRAGDAEPRWRQLDDGLWAGWAGTRCLGTIERGRRFTWLDADGEPRGDYPDLRGAQHAAECPDRAASAARRRGGHAIPAGVVLVVLSAGIGLVGWATGLAFPV